MSNEPYGRSRAIEYDPETETYRALYDEDLCSPSEAVLKVISTITGLGELELDPLYEALDPEYLDEFLANGMQTTDRQVRFRYHDCEVTVKSYGVVEVTE